MSTDDQRRSDHGHRGSGQGPSDRGQGRRDPRSDRGQGRGDARSDRGQRGQGRGDDDRRKGVDVPGGSRGEPIGLDRARQRPDAPPRAAAKRTAPPRPPLPDDEQPQLPKPVKREIERTLGSGPKSRDIALALSIGSAAIDEERIDVALQVLAWAKHEAPRISAIREAYGVALYLGEQYAAALTELQAYRRLTGQSDQNHLVADCLRALGRDLDQIAEAAESLLVDEDAPDDRRAEAAIVWAAALADNGDLGAARSVVRRFLERTRTEDAEHDLRVRYLAADLAEQQGDLDEAERQLASVAAVDDEFLDARERLETIRTTRA